MWLCKKIVENIKLMESLFLQIFVDQLQCLMFEAISYKSKFPVDGFIVLPQTWNF